MITANYNLNNYYTASAAAKYNFIEESFVGWRSNTMPMSFRKIVQAELSSQTPSVASPLGDNRSVCIKAFMAGTVGAAFTCVARIIRIAAWTVFLIPAAAVRSFSAARYGQEGAMKEFFKRYGEEFVDLGVTVISVPMGVIKAFKPSVFKGATDSITNYYLERVKRRLQFDVSFQNHKREYAKSVLDAAAVRNETI